MELSASFSQACLPMSLASSVPGPLAGLRIIEFSAFVAVPSAGRALAQLGAEVIRIDPPGGNIDTRRLPLNAEGRSLYWGSLNQGKRSVILDLRSAEGQARLRALLGKPGEPGGIFLTNLGVEGALSDAALRAHRADLITVRLIGSSDGRNAVDYTVNCATGYPLITGSGGAPTNHVLPAWDLVAGMTLATAILAAERHRMRTGEGQEVRLALSDVAFAATAALGNIADIEVNGAHRHADGNHLYGAYGDAFQIADGSWVMVVALSHRQWKALIQAIGLEEAIQTAAGALGYRLDTEGGRWEARSLISTALKPWFARQTRAGLEAAFRDPSILWGRHQTLEQALAEDPRLSEANPMFRRMEHPGYGRYLTAGSPLDFSRFPRTIPALAPQLGADTEAILAGLSDTSVPVTPQDESTSQ